MTDAPRSAADPRPGGEPYYIDSACPDCGAELVLYDSLDPLTIWNADALGKPPDSEVIWHDEWVCPDCLDGIHLDWPEEWLNRLDSQEYDRADFVPLEEV